MANLNVQELVTFLAMEGGLTQQLKDLHFRFPRYGSLSSYR